jgi:hypothetical protein
LSVMGDHVNKTKAFAVPANMKVRRITQRKEYT